MMGFNFTAFAGGFAGALAEDIDKEEKLAEARAIGGVKNMADTYKTVMSENRKLKSELVENINALRTYDPSATEDQLFEIAKSPALMEMLAAKVKSGDYNADVFSLGNFANVAKSNVTSTALERTEEMFKIPKVLESQKEEKAATTGNFFRDIITGSGTKAGERAARETAAAMGVSLEELRAAKQYVAPSLTSTATAKMEEFKKQPDNTKDILDRLEVGVVQAAAKFGEGSPQYIKALDERNRQKAQVDKLEAVADKNLEARAQRLLLQKQDTKDPQRIAELNKEIKDIQTSLKQHNQATRATDPKEKEATYVRMKTSVNDYVNTRMKNDKGFDWNKYVDFKTFEDPATGTTITSRTQKAGLSIDDQRLVFAKERELTAQALKANGYVLTDGTPRTPAASELMINFNITAKELTAPSAEQPLPLANAPVQTAPAAAPKGKAPPQAAIDLLKANPSIAADFEKKYPGYSAKTYLGK